MTPLFDRLDALPPLSPEERQLLDSVRALARDEIAPRAAGYDRSGEFPWENVEAINALGLNAMFVPETYGGAGLSYAAYLACVREISAACASTGIIWATNFHAIKPLIDFGSEEQKQRLLPRVAEGALCALAITEPDAGSDATGMKTRFTPAGNDGVVIDGGKTFITNGDVADLILLFGKWSELPASSDKNGRGAITALYLEKDTPGFSVLRKEDKLGHRASSTAALAFDQCHVPRANVLGEPGQGLPLLLAALNKSRPSVAAHALGIARAAFGDAVAYINERRQSGRRIVEFQGIQFLLADLATDLAMCEAWLWHVAGLVDAGIADIGPEASMLKMRASDLAMRCATEAVQLYGGYGYIADNRVERLLRDAKITQIWEGTNQLHRQLIGRSFIVR
jgi:alkylation response protein AidB-like acyl-CoA dehydrogenase